MAVWRLTVTGTDWSKVQAARSVREVDLFAYYLYAETMASTTIRVDIETHARLQALSEQSGTTLIETVRDATEALRRLRFARQVAAELSELSADEESWKDYLADADATFVSDGIR